jgi:ribulose-phosphate 3-epimerase
MSFRIYPAILTDSLELAQAQLEIVRAAEVVDIVQLDVIDGNFADRLTLSPSDYAELDFGDLRVDLHLMVDEPLDFVYEAVGSAKGAPIRAVIAQIEHMSHIESYVDEVKRQGWLTGVSLDIFTDLEELSDDTWGMIGIIQIMGNQAGMQGEELHPHLIPKLTELHEMVLKREFEGEILVDIGMKASTIPRVKAAGATGCAVGSGIWKAADPILELQKLVAAVER